MTQAPAVKISHLSKKFSANGPIIIDDLNLEIRAGEFVSLVGASGCGKSTLLNILSGLDSATSGTVELRCLYSPPPICRVRPPSYTATTSPFRRPIMYNGISAASFSPSAGAVVSPSSARTNSINNPAGNDGPQSQ